MFIIKCISLILSQIVVACFEYAQSVFVRAAWIFLTVISVNIIYIYIYTNMSIYIVPCLFRILTSMCAFCLFFSSDSKLYWLVGYLGHVLVIIVLYSTYIKEWCGLKNVLKSHPTRAQHTLSATGTVQVSHALITIIQFVNLVSHATR
jgi:hypothetical protein